MDRKTSQVDLRMMARAIALSRRGYPAPNPHVGCVIAQGEQIVGEGFHAFAGGPHAEAAALRKAGEKARGATAYITMEPCNHHGRTPPCSDALLAAGIARVVAALPDPIPSHAGGLSQLSSHHVETEVNLLSDEARLANLPWLTAIGRGSPYVVVKAAATLDGRIATPSGESKWITGEAARKEAHRLRAECGAVLVGRSTVEHDNPSLTVRAIKVPNQPVRIVLDPSHKLPSSLNVFNGEASTIRAVEGPSQEGEMSVSLRDGRIDLKRFLRDLFARGVTSVLVEGGGYTIGSFFEAGLVDRVELFLAGKVLGAGRSWVENPFAGSIESAPLLEIASVRKVGGDLWITAFPR